MRHFYYGLYGLGPWYWDMEERLHNPFFVGARSWNGPVEAWVGENQIFPGDLPTACSDPRQHALQIAKGVARKAGIVLRDMFKHLRQIILSYLSHLPLHSLYVSKGYWPPGFYPL